ncbi:MAG: FAD-dependent oxidoreductase [Burkholderiales bacterium]|nr:FAD-dependent oxidoreductase [Burkholderiales bacterium]
MTRIAVVGSGIAGLTAAWLLSQRHAVTLFEAAGTLGGHTHTVDVELGGMRFPVDTGFLVFNDRTYPNLCSLFDHLGVATAASEMSFSVRVDEDRLEWAGSSLATVFAQKRNLVKPEFWRMLQEILRFNRESTAAVECGMDEGETLGRFLDRGGYGRAFREWYLLPMSAAIWSCPTGSMLGFPAATFLRFCHNHGLLQVNGRPKWRTVVGGGREYVRRLAARIDDVRVGTPVLGVRRSADAVELRLANTSERFDAVVLATHSDQSAVMLEDADAAERNVLDPVRYQPNRAWLHTDETLLPRARDAWSAWNYLTGPARVDGRPVSVSYLINKLQPLPVETPVIVTLNPVHEPRADRVIRRIDYAHPVFDPAAIEAQRHLSSIQGRRRTWFCGAWTGYGFHEDGLRSGLAVANAMGVTAPWQKRALVA